MQIGGGDDNGAAAAKPASAAKHRHGRPGKVARAHLVVKAVASVENLPNRQCEGCTCDREQRGCVSLTVVQPCMQCGLGSRARVGNKLQPRWTLRQPGQNDAPVLGTCIRTTLSNGSDSFAKSPRHASMAGVARRSLEYLRERHGHITTNTATHHRYNQPYTALQVSRMARMLLQLLRRWQACVSMAHSLGIILVQRAHHHRALRPGFNFMPTKRCANNCREQQPHMPDDVVHFSAAAAAASNGQKKSVSSRSWHPPPTHPPQLQLKAPTQSSNSQVPTQAAAGWLAGSLHSCCSC